MYSEGKLPWESDLTIWINIITIRALSIPTQTPFSIYQHFLRSPFVKTRLYEKIFSPSIPFYGSAYGNVWLNLHLLALCITYNNSGNQKTISEISFSSEWRKAAATTCGDGESLGQVENYLGFHSAFREKLKSLKAMNGKFSKFVLQLPHL